MTTVIKITEDDFIATYPLLPNHIDTNASWSYGDGPGCLFETYGEQIEFVRQQNPRTIWTLIEADGVSFLQSGFHWVNRLGFLISTVPFPEGQEIQVRIEENEGDLP